MLSAPLRRTLELGELTELVQAIANDESLWLPRLRFNRSGRWWTKLYGDETVDLWLLSWLPDQETDLHDHGDSSAAFTVVQGSLRELRPSGGEMASHRREPGETVWVAPGVVHDVGNEWETPAVSIHAYSPPLSSMTYYRQTGDGLVAVETRPSDSPER